MTRGKRRLEGRAQRRTEMRGTHCVQEERNKRKRYERGKGRTEKDEVGKKKVVEEIDGEKSKRRETEKKE